MMNFTVLLPVPKTVQKKLLLTPNSLFNLPLPVGFVVITLKNHTAPRGATASQDLSCRRR